MQQVDKVILNPNVPYKILVNANYSYKTILSSTTTMEPNTKEIKTIQKVVNNYDSDREDEMLQLMQQQKTMNYIIITFLILIFLVLLTVGLYFIIKKCLKTFEKKVERRIQQVNERELNNVIREA